ncbi:MAG: ubiquitin-like protein, partial [Bacteroidota bacterium]
INIIKEYEKKYIKKYPSKDGWEFEKLSYYNKEDKYSSYQLDPSYDNFDKERIISDWRIKEFTNITPIFELKKSEKEIEVTFCLHQKNGIGFSEFQVFKVNTKESIKNIKKIINKNWNNKNEQLPEKYSLFSDNLMEEDKSLSSYGIDGISKGSPSNPVSLFPLEDDDSGKEIAVSFCIKKQTGEISEKFQTFLVNTKESIKNIKEIINKNWDDENEQLPEKYSLSFHKKTLEGTQTLSDYGIEAGATVFLVPETIKEDNDSGKEIEVTIRVLKANTLNGKELTKTIKLNEKDAVQDMREKIKKQWDIMPPAEQQRLFFQGVFLEDGRGIYSYNIKNKSVVILEPHNYKIQVQTDQEEGSGKKKPGDKGKNDGIGGAWVIIPAITVTVIVVFGIFLFLKKRKKANKK